jgi:predicted Co/Zn/Cd cation transporter (cation efflux family)
MLKQTSHFASLISFGMAKNVNNAWMVAYVHPSWVAIVAFRDIITWPLQKLVRDAMEILSMNAAMK